MEPEAVDLLTPIEPERRIINDTAAVLADRLGLNNHVAATVRVSVSPPEAIVNVSPAVTAFAVTPPAPLYTPAVDASQIENFEYVSEPATLVQVSAPFVAFVPPDDDANVAAFLVVSVAGEPVPDVPGVPVCSLINGVEMTVAT